MKFPARNRLHNQSGFTLAEVLAALVFMAIVVPVAIEGLNVASRAGEVAVRKGEAGLLAERILNESVATTNWSQAMQTGNLRQGIRDYKFTVRNETWSEEPSQNDVRLLSVEITYAVQGRDYTFSMSTLVDEYTPFAETNSNY
jgi:prepilin-type N-terminal cleavage/methylation domain-containing protein